MKKISFLVITLILTMCYCCQVFAVEPESTTENEAKWVTIDGNIYYYDEDGNQVRGMKKIEDKYYFFSNLNGALKHGWQALDGNTWYQDESGALVIGDQTIENNQYLFSEEGYLQKGLIERTISGVTKKYFYSNLNGALKHGWQALDGNTWYQDKDGALVTGDQTIDKNKYLFNEEGYLQKGFIDRVIDGVTKKFFYSNLNGALKYGWQSSNGNTWYQDKSGAVVTGDQTIDKNKYLFNEEGYLQKGFIDRVIDGVTKKFFYSNLNGALKYGWQSSNGNTWYQDKSGVVLTGDQIIDKNKYLFNEEGYLQKGFIERTINGVTKKYYYSNLNGALKYGWQSSNGNTWYQDKDGALVTGDQTINNNQFLFNEEGYLQKGFIERTIDGVTKKYFYSNVNGALKHGWQYLNDDIWYQDSQGALVTGLQTVDGRDYSFNETSGMLNGFTYVNGKKYYYDPDGTLNKGIQYIAGKHWKFNETTGSFEKFVRQIRVADISVHNGDINWDQVKASGLVDAVILRLGYGQRWFDDNFFKNKAELERLGIPYSIYLFSYAENSQEALAESNFVINAIRDHKINIATNIFSIYYDLESWRIEKTGENSDGISKDAYGQIITTFVDNVERNLCIKTRVYSSEYYVYDRFPDYTYQYATWIANWTNRGITYPYNYEGWQYTSKADIPGIPWAWNKDTQQWEPHTDMSIFYY